MKEGSGREQNQIKGFPTAGNTIKGGIVTVGKIEVSIYRAC